MKKVKVATVWLDGCSGCHMSLLDMDAAIISLGRKIDIVYGPLVDAQEFPEEVDLTLVEGAVSSQDDLNKIRKIRQRTQILVSLGDCAVTGNVPAMRNNIPGQQTSATRLCGRRGRKEADSQRPRARAPEAGASAARVCQGRPLSARVPATRQGDSRIDHRPAGRAQAGSRPDGKVRLRSAR